MDCADDGALLTWSWLLFKVTELEQHMARVVLNGAVLCCAVLHAVLRCAVQQSPNSLVRPALPLPCFVTDCCV